MLLNAHTHTFFNQTGLHFTATQFQTCTATACSTLLACSTIGGPCDHFCKFWESVKFFSVLPPGGWCSLPVPGPSEAPSLCPRGAARTTSWAAPCTSTTATRPAASSLATASASWTRSGPRPGHTVAVPRGVVYVAPILPMKGAVPLPIPLPLPRGAGAMQRRGPSTWQMPLSAPECSPAGLCLFWHRHRHRQITAAPPPVTGNRWNGGAWQ